MSALHNHTHASVFSTTQWTVILEAANPDAAESQAAFAQLYRDYWNPLYYYVRRRGYPPADSEDITQSFFVALIEKRRLSSLEREGGRFRSYLLSCLSNFLANEWDRARSLKRGEGRQLFSINADTDTVEARFVLEQSSGETPETLFEKRWVLTLLGHVMERLRSECAAEGKLGFFKDVHLHLQGDRQGLPYPEIAQRHAMSEGALRVAVHRMRKRYGQLLRAEIARTVSRPEEVDEELRHLIVALSQ
jgi:RNA polymerase sigma factor (sigma-70 family)